MSIFYGLKYLFLDATFYQVDIQFSGSLVGKIVGLYKSVYTDPTTGEEKLEFFLFLLNFHKI